MHSFIQPSAHCRPPPTKRFHISPFAFLDSLQRASLEQWLVPRRLLTHERKHTLMQTIPAAFSRGRKRKRKLGVSKQGPLYLKSHCVTFHSTIRLRMQASISLRMFLMKGTSRNMSQARGTAGEQGGAF